MSDQLTRAAYVLGGGGIAAIAIALAGDLPFYAGLTVLTQQALAIVLGLALALVFLRVRVTGKSEGPAPWYDVVLALMALLAGVYVAVRYPEVSREFFARRGEAFGVGILLIPLVIEALRRTAGLGLVVILSVFLLYGLFAHLVPGQLNGRSQSLYKLVAYLSIDLNAMFGLPLIIITTIVVLFILFGQVLLRSGGSEWFTDLAMAIAGRSRGGSAKIAVVASALFGSISGSAVSNVASTGVLTIPLMRRGGYSKPAAGAFEAVASTGGQIMPPIMGAAAFLMAERLQIPYGEIILAALIPAVLYYIAVFIQADVEAARRNIPPVPEDQIRPLATVLREGWYFALPFAVLIVALFWLNRRPETAALWAIGTSIVFSMFLSYKGNRLTLRDLFQSIVSAGTVAVDILVIGAMAGLIIGVVEVTGLSFGLTFVLVQIGGESLFLLLLLTAVVSIILGMGMPTTAIYLIVATLAAPPLVQLGVDRIAADLFVLYYGLLSMITPPVAIAAFTAANLADARPMATAVLACRYGWPAFVLPFLFVLSPSLLLQGSAGEVALSVATAVAGVWLASAGLGGFFRGRLDLLGRATFVVAGIALLIPANAFAGALWVELGGVALAGVAIVRGVMTARRRLA